MRNLFMFFTLLPMIKTVLQAEIKTLNIMGLLPMSGEKWSGGGACLTAAEMALRHVNGRNDVLKDFKLDLHWRDGECDIGRAINRMYDLLYSKPQKHIILGPGCSEVLEVAAQVTPSWHITHITYGGASPLLSDRTRYPKLFKIEAPDSRFNLARIALAQHYGWKKLATLNVALDYFSARPKESHSLAKSVAMQRKDTYSRHSTVASRQLFKVSQVSDNLVHSTKTSDISIISQEIFDHDPLTRIQNLKKKDARIILMASYENHAKRVLCAAYKEGLYGPRIVWMFPGWYRDQWWTDPTTVVDCTNEQMASVAEGSLLTGNMYENMDVKRGIANLTVQEYRQLYKQEESYRPELRDFEDIGPKCYDVIWAIGLTLNCTDRILKEIGHPKSLVQFNYTDEDIGNMVTACVYNVSFLGITGQVKFERSGDPMRNIKIDQIQGGKKKMVGIYRTDVEDWHMEWYGDGIVWKDGIVPRDSTLVSEVEVLIPPYLYVVMSCFAGFGILLAIFLLVFNITHRENVFIKLSSPNINNVLLLGCILTYISVFIESLEQRNAVLCKLRTYTFTVGFSTAFGALFSKTWRVYRIFSNKKLLRFIKDFQLVVIVLGILGILSFVLILWEIIDPLFIVIRPLKNEAYLIDTDAEILPYIRACTSNYYSYFSWTLCIMEGALLTFGAFLAFETRKVKIAALNDSHFIGMCLYNVVVLSAVGLTLNLVLEDKLALLYGIISGVLIIGTTATQLVVFIPKIMTVYHPHHVDIDKRAVLNGTRFTSTMYASKFTPREPCDTTVSTLTQSVSHANHEQDCSNA